MSTNPRKFGVEIEISHGSKKYQAKKALEDLGEPVKLYNSKIHNNFHVWAVKDESSTNYEITTPILRGKTGLRRLKRAIQKIALINAISVDEDCALHVHIDTSDFSREEMKNLVSEWTKIEKVIRNAFPKDRSTIYARLLSKFGKDFDKIFLSISDKRNVALNICSWLSKGTVEFRIAEGTIDADIIICWTQILLRFVEKSKTVKKQIYKSYTVNQIHKPLGLDKVIDKKLVDWLYSRINEFSKNRVLKSKVEKIVQKSKNDFKKINS